MFLPHNLCPTKLYRTTQNHIIKKTKVLSIKSENYTCVFNKSKHKLREKYTYFQNRSKFEVRECGKHGPRARALPPDSGNTVLYGMTDAGRECVQVKDFKY